MAGSRGTSLSIRPRGAALHPVRRAVLVEHHRTGRRMSAARPGNRPGCARRKFLRGSALTDGGHVIRLASRSDRLFDRLSRPAVARQSRKFRARSFIEDLARIVSGGALYAPGLTEASENRVELGGITAGSRQQRT